MDYSPAVMGVAALVGLVVFFWRRVGPGSGRTFGNRIAAHIDVPRSVFYALLDNGVKDSSRELLASLAKSKPGLDEASVELGPTLSRGIERLEARFGTQESYEKVKPIVAGLVAKAERQKRATVI